MAASQHVDGFQFAARSFKGRHRITLLRTARKRGETTPVSQRDVGVRKSHLRLGKRQSHCRTPSAACGERPRVCQLWRVDPRSRSCQLWRVDPGSRIRQDAKRVPSRWRGRQVLESGRGLPQSRTRSVCQDGGGGARFWSAAVLSRFKRVRRYGRLAPIHQRLLMVRMKREPWLMAGEAKQGSPRGLRAISSNFGAARSTKVLPSSSRK